MIKNVSLNTISYSKGVISFLLLAFIVTSLNGQEVWTTSQFLNTDYPNDVLPYQESLDFLNNKAKGMPFVDQYEFRTETDEMEFERQDYQFRFKFNSRDERKAYDKILSANKNRYVWLQAQFELKEWEEKYKNIIDLYFLQKEMELIKHDLALLSDKKTVYKKILDNKAKVDVVDWISNEEEVFNTLLDSLDSEVQKKELALKIFGFSRVLPRLEDTGFIQIKDLQKLVSDVLSDDGQHPDGGLALAEEELAQAEFKLEQAEADKWLEFAQVQYRAEDKLSFQKEISIGTSITIPNRNNNRLKKNDAALKLLEKNYKTNLKQEENKNEVILEELKFINLLQQLEEYKKMRNNQKLDVMFDTYSKNKIVSPLVLIGLKRSIVKNEKRQLDLEKEIYGSYIKILTKKAVFLKVPRINYLSK